MAVGLAQSKYVNAFVREATKLLGAAETRENAAKKQIVKAEVGKSIVISLFKTLVGWLKDEGMSKEIRLLIDKASGFGAFSDQIWALTLNETYFGGTSMTVNKVKEMAVTEYHECRHAEQYFLMICYLWTDFPKLTDVEIQKKLSLIETLGTDIDAIKAAKFSKLDKKSEAYSFAKSLYEGEFTKIQKANQNKPLPLNEVGKFLLESTHERVAANNKFDDAQAYCKRIKLEIEAYNKAAPVLKPLPLDVTCPGAANDLQKANPPGDAFLKAYWTYLTMRRHFAISQYQGAYTSYILCGIESDAHAVETAVRTQLQMDTIGSKVSNIPNPVDWTAAPKVMATTAASSSSSSADLPPGFPKKPNYPPPKPPVN